MSTGYYTRVENTVVNGSQLQSALSGENVRMLEFDAALKIPASVLTVAGGTTLSPNQWVQAAIGSLVLTGLGSTTGAIDVGADVQSQAESYIALFDLKSTNDIRLLRMNVDNDCTNLYIKNTGAALSNGNVQVGTDSVFSSGKANLFTGAGIGSAALGLAGSERIILIQTTNLTEGSQNVQFNVMPYSM